MATSTPTTARPSQVPRAPAERRRNPPEPPSTNAVGSSRTPAGATSVGLSSVWAMWAANLPAVPGPPADARRARPHGVAAARARPLTTVARVIETAEATDARRPPEGWRRLGSAAERHPVGAAAMVAVALGLPLLVAVAVL